MRMHLPRNAPMSALIALALMLQAAPARAAENRPIMQWSNSPEKIEELEELCMACGILSSDVFWANGYEMTVLPSEGKSLLIPGSKSDALQMWMEIQSAQTGGSEPLVTIKLHGVPAGQRIPEPNKTLLPPRSEDMAAVTETTSSSTVPVLEAPEPERINSDEGESALDDLLKTLKSADQPTKTPLPLPEDAPLVTVKLHGVPSFAQSQTAEADRTVSIDTVAASTASRDIVKNSADEMPKPSASGATENKASLSTISIDAKPSLTEEKPSAPLNAVPVSDTVSDDTSKVMPIPVSPDISRPASEDLSSAALPAAEMKKSDPVAESPVSNSSIKNMSLIVSGDELIIKTSSGNLSAGSPPTEKPSPKGPTARELAALPPLILTPPAATLQKPPTSAPFVAPGKMMWPVRGKVSSGYGRRGKRSFHAGIDLPMPKGTPILAAMDGVVLETCTTQSPKYRGYGNAALIDHGNGVVTMYAHCQSVSVKTGQKIKQGDIVGLVGNTGRTTTHHVHFEVRKNGKAVDPVPYLTPR